MDFSKAPEVFVSVNQYTITYGKSGGDSDNG